MRKIEFKDIKNVRDLGGLKTVDGREIKKGFLVRGAHLNNPSKEDIEKLKTFNFTDIVDFRGKYEFDNIPDVKLEGVNYHNLSPLKMLENRTEKGEDANLLQALSSPNGGFDFMMKIYTVMFKEQEAIEVYRKFFEIVSKENVRVFWHCAQGKDRAGLAAFLLEYALGVSLEDCYQDYLLTNEASKEKIEENRPDIMKQYNGSEEVMERLTDLFLARKEYLDKAVEEILKDYGSIDKLLEILNVDREKLKQMYLK